MSGWILHKRMIKSVETVKEARECRKAAAIVLDQMGWEMRAAGTWIDKQGELIFLDSGTAAVLALGTTYALLENIDGQNIRAYPADDGVIRFYI